MTTPPIDLPPPARFTLLDVRIGARPRAALRLRGIDTSSLVREQKGGVTSWVGQLGAAGGWERIGVLWNWQDKARFYRIEPGTSDTPAGEIAMDDLYVRGRFVVAQIINHAHRAREAFSALPSMLAVRATCAASSS